MVALGGLLDTDSSLATLPDERAVKYSAQTQEVLDATRFDEDEFHRYNRRLVSAAQYEPAGCTWRTPSYCALRQARRRAAKKGRRTRVFFGTWREERSKVLVSTLVSTGGDFTLPSFAAPPPSDGPRHRIG